jgi:hypothetical protein
MGAIETANRLKSVFVGDGGEFIWNRDSPNFGNPASTVASYTTTRD